LSDFDPEELLALARRDLDAGRLEEALLKLKRLIAGKDALVDAFPFAARVYGQLGLIEKARACYKRYLEAKPGALPESFELGITYFEGGDPKEARQIWDRVLSAAPTHPPTLFYSGLLAARDGRVPDARRNLDVLFKSTPADNLYVTRGRELLNDIERESQGAEAVAGKTAPPPAAVKPGH
jgi:tetratricopeptide (TPR) repeat protein